MKHQRQVPSGRCTIRPQLNTASGERRALRVWPRHRPAEPDPARTGEGSRPVTRCAVPARRRRSSIDRRFGSDHDDDIRHIAPRAPFRTHAGGRATSSSRPSSASCSGSCSRPGTYATRARPVFAVAPPLRDLIYGIWLDPGHPRPARDPQARRRAVRGDGRRRRVGASRQPVGRRTRCCPASSRARPRSWSSHSRSIALVGPDHAGHRRARECRSPRGSTTGSCTTRRSTDIQVVRLVVDGRLGGGHRGGGSLPLERSLRGTGVLDGFPA